MVVFIVQVFLKGSDFKAIYAMAVSGSSTRTTSVFVAPELLSRIFARSTSSDEPDEP